MEDNLPLTANYLAHPMPVIKEAKPCGCLTPDGPCLSQRGSTAFRARGRIGTELCWLFPAPLESCKHSSPPFDRSAAASVCMPGTQKRKRAPFADATPGLPAVLSQPRTFSRRAILRFKNCTTSCRLNGPVGNAPNWAPHTCKRPRSRLQQISRGLEEEKRKNPHSCNVDAAGAKHLALFFAFFLFTPLSEGLCFRL